MTRYPKSVILAFAAAVSARRTYRFESEATDAVAEMYGLSHPEMIAAMLRERAARKEMYSAYTTLSNVVAEADPARFGYDSSEWMRCFKLSADGPQVAYILPGDVPTRYEVMAED